VTFSRRHRGWSSGSGSSTKVSQHGATDLVRVEGARTRAASSTSAPLRDVHQPRLGLMAARASASMVPAVADVRGKPEHDVVGVGELCPPVLRRHHAGHAGGKVGRDPGATRP